MNIVIKLYLYFLLVLLLLTTGCTYHNPYPQGWAQLNKNDDGLCGNISGTFTNLAVDSTASCYFYDQYVSNSCLISEIFRKKKDKSKAFTKSDDIVTGKVLINNLNPGKISITVLAEGQELFNQTLSINDSDFECLPQGIMIKLPIDWKGPNDGLPAVAAEKRKLLIFKSDDGSLVLKEKISTSGLAVIVPVSTSGTHWYRWQPLKLP